MEEEKAAAHHCEAAHPNEMYKDRMVYLSVQEKSHIRIPGMIGISSPSFFAVA